MAITISNVSTLIAVYNINRNTAAMQTTLERLSTGLRINSAADDPAGLIASESIEAEEATTKAGIANAQREDQMLATADGGLSEISNLLINLQGLVTASANTGALSPDEIQANQLQVDSIVASINRIANSTTFDGKKLLDGQFAYTTSAGPNSQSLQNLQVNAAQPLKNGETVGVEVIASARQAALVYHGQAGGLSAPVTISVAGADGDITLSFASSTSAGAIASAVNQFSGSTGITASTSANDVAFVSTGYGSQEFVSVQSTSAAFQTETLSGASANNSKGRDATVSLNGQTLQSEGLSVITRGNGFDASFLLAPQLNTDGATAQFTVTGGGATFAPDGDPNDPDSFAINSDNTASLGISQSASKSYSLADLGSSGPASLSSGHLDISQQIVGNAIQDVSQQRASIGAKREYEIQSTINSLNVKLENLESADSTIKDTDFATETANLAREQILAQTSQFALKAAEQSQQIILKLIGAQ